MDYAIHRLEMQGVLKIKPEGNTHRISLTEEVDLLEEEEVETLRGEEIQKIEDIISKFAIKSAMLLGNYNH